VLAGSSAIAIPLIEHTPLSAIARDAALIGIGTGTHGEHGIGVADWQEVPVLVEVLPPFIAVTGVIRLGC
jgi:hypothetical protein